MNEKEIAKINSDAKLTKKEAYAQIMDIYTDEQREVAKRVLSENSTLETKKKCKFCANDTPKMKCKGCKNRAKEDENF